MSGDVDTLGPVDAAPREGCPAWCTEHVDQVNYHRTIRYIDGPIGRRVLVALIQQADGKYLPDLYVNAVRVDEDHITHMRWLMSDLGCEDIAAAIDELAALA